MIDDYELSLKQRKKHAHRIPYATARIAALIGIKVQSANHKPKHRIDQCGVFEVEGVKRKFIGVPQVREWLYDKGIALTIHGVSKRFDNGEAHIGGYTIRRVGTVSRNEAGVHRNFARGPL